MRPAPSTRSADLNAVQGAARKAHFAAGGTTRTWRGHSVRFTNRKADAARKACRRPNLEG
jgi:hypothetical protein